ncbi:MAG: hypothetical protein LBT51_05250 [Fusobacteriaceae bacterium]|jgi:hypothetical protein|nr:hypothetical protein [Fusobacteriaceae bacterium]
MLNKTLIIVILISILGLVIATYFIFKNKEKIDKTTLKSLAFEYLKSIAMQMVIKMEEKYGTGGGDKKLEEGVKELKKYTPDWLDFFIPDSILVDLVQWGFNKLKKYLKASSLVEQLTPVLDVKNILNTIADTEDPELNNRLEAFFEIDSDLKKKQSLEAE